jgi:predicted DNA-binding transcriptional regulator AlpA
VNDVSIATTTETTDGLRLISAAELGERTGLPRNRIYDLTKQGMPHVPLGGRKYFRPAEVEAWLGELETASAGSA